LQDSDYRMRVNHAFEIHHLDTYLPLYSYRVHDNSLSRRAAELKIDERLDRLMHYERGRHAFFQKSWTFVIDSAMKTRLSPDFLPPHLVVDLPRAIEQGIGGRPGEAKLLSLIEAGLAASTLVAAWFDSEDEAYDRRVESTRFRMIGFTDRVEIAERLELLGMNAVVVGSVRTMVELAVRYANNRAYYEQTRSR